MGSDRDRNGFRSWGGVISIHAPAWGATGYRQHVGRVHPISIHAPAWGATDPGRLPYGSPIFQSTLPHGERLGSGS